MAGPPVFMEDPANKAHKYRVDAMLAAVENAKPKDPFAPKKPKISGLARFRRASKKIQAQNRALKMFFDAGGGGNSGDDAWKKETVQRFGAAPAGNGAGSSVAVDAVLDADGNPVAAPTTAVAVPTRSGAVQETLDFTHGFDQCAVVRIWTKQEPRVRSKVPGFVLRFHSFIFKTFGHSPETRKWAEGTPTGETMEMDVCGPYHSEYANLREFLTPNNPPIIVIATGGGAGMVLDVCSTIRGYNNGAGLPLQCPVEIIFSTWSVALLQFVTDTILDEGVPGLFITAALTRQSDDMVKSAKEWANAGGGASKVQFTRINFKDTILKTKLDNTRVYFCGSGVVCRIVRSACAERGLPFVGAEVE